MCSGCAMCGNPITEKFWACEACERAYDLPKDFHLWPAWAKFMANDEQKRRRLERHVIQVIPVSQLPGVERLWYGESNDDPV